MIARTGYLVSCVSFVLFLALDWMRPGFVSHFLSPHLFLLTAVVFGVIWAREAKAEASVHVLVWAAALFPLAFVLALFAWVEGRPFGDARILVTLVAFAVPWIVFNQLTNRT